MDRPKIVVTNPVHPDVLDLLQTRCTVAVNHESNPWSDSKILTHMRDAVGMIAFMSDRIDGQFLDQCENLRIIGGVLKGFDNFDVQACTDRGIWFTVVQETLTVPTVELTVGLMIAISRHIVEADAQVRRGHQGWRPILYGLGLQHSTVGILGMGAIGQALANRLKAFECQILYFDYEPCFHVPDMTFASLDDVLKSDFVVVALPLTARTQHLLNSRTLRSMKSSAYLINTARGSIVDEEAVADALINDRLAGYAADVFELEDWSRADRPKGISSRLLSNKSRTVLTPHLGSAERHARRTAELEIAHSILDCLDGRMPRGAVNNPMARNAGAKC
ncbi:MAG TPA: NAD(P)-dependent oxidoreductase [Bryobacteraceae bacterium]|nr:NAD(P)-dependent oxidoreductase [Bryobacteraceae bacterium]